MNPLRRERPPHNAQVLERWAREWADAERVPVARVQRLVSYMVIAAMLDTMRGADGEPLFLIKGGVAMELRLALRARATQDLDAAFRATAEEMIERLDDALEAGHAGFTASRTAAQEGGETRAVRVGVKLAYRRRPWATVPLEISSAEGRSGAEFERVPARPLDPLGIEVPAEIPCVSLRYQIAQKLHACTQVFDDGPANSRFRDLIDLLLLRELLAADHLLSVRAACVETFELRATHPWPPTVAIGAAWAPAYAQLAAAAGFHVTDVEDAAERVRALIAEIDRAL
jgi:nucleotidyltransferase AbiEii toxin of type IV toxin-antitoxin system